MGGSSPLSRGIRTCGSQIPALRRIIPALAGNTRQSPSPRPRGQDHPRSRGEYQGPQPQAVPGDGSSPLSRGIRRRRGGRVDVVRIIPALAGNTVTRVENLGARSDHPRSRGEYQDSLFSEPSDVGSSPLSRGIHNAGRKDVPFVRIIPALAGNTGPNGTSNRSCTDHPRSRGEYSFDHPALPGTRGSSPLSRGIPDFLPEDGVDLRIIPALAGNTSGGCSP